MLSPWRRFLSRIRLLTGFADSARQEREITEEMRFHLAMQAARYRGEGMSAAEADRAAAVAFGGVARWREAGRDQQRSLSLHEYGRDLRHAGRSLRRAPAFTIGVVLTLAIGIGAVSTVYTVVDRVLLRALPYQDPDRIVALWTSSTTNPAQQGVHSYRNLEDWTQDNPDLAAVATMNAWRALLSDGDPESLEGVSVTHDFFRVLGAAPLLGRTFVPADDSAAASRLVVIAHSLWQRRFGGDPSIVGRAATINGASYTIIGVMPASFRNPEPLVNRAAELWRPLILPATMKNRGTFFLRVIARLKPGVTPEAAERRLDQIAERLAADHPDINKGRTALVVPMLDQVIGPSRTLILAALGAALCLLLIACGNVANLVLTRHSLRAPEIAVRTALGASRRRVVRLLFAESLILALAGGAAGVGLASLATALLRHAAPIDLPRLGEIAVDGRILALCALFVLGTSIFFGLVPALRSSRGDVARMVRAGAGAGTSRSAHGTRGAIVVTQVALALTLLTATLLLGRSVLGLMTTELGLDPASIYTFQLTGGLARVTDAASEQAAMDELMTRLRRIPGVDAVGTTSAVPLSGSDQTGTITGWTEAPLAVPLETHVRTLEGDYFAAVGTPLLAGRTFDARDAAGADPVAIINQRAARAFFGTTDPVGKRIRMHPADTTPALVVGVARDIRFGGPMTDPVPELYQPDAQAGWGGTPSFILHTRRATSAAFAGEVRAAVRTMGSTIAVTNAGPLSDALAEFAVRQRFYGIVIGTFATIGLLLATIGIYGLIAYLAVAQRRETAIRIALGATASGIVGRFVTRVSLLVGVGLLLGLATSLAVGRAFRSLLFGVTPNDPLTLAGGALFLAVLAMVASAVPARAATRLSIVATLKGN